MIKEVSTINEVVNGSFGWLKPSQILLLNEINPHDYNELAQYFLSKSTEARVDQRSISINEIIYAMNDRSLSKQSLQAAQRLYRDLSEVRILTDKVGLYVQAPDYENAASKWHYDRNDRTILVKYNGAATQIVLAEDVLGSHDNDMSLHGGFIACDVRPDAKIIEIDKGSLYSISGTDRLMGKPTAHRKAPLDGQVSLTLIGEP